MRASLALVASVVAHAALIILAVLWAKLPGAAVPSSEVEMQMIPSPMGEGARRAGEGPTEQQPVQPRSVPAPHRRAKAAPRPAAESAPEEPIANLIMGGGPIVPQPTADSAAGPSSGPSDHLLPTGEGTVDAELHQRLQASAARCYPASSRRFHESGVSEVSFCIDENGKLGDGNLTRSSGSVHLDHAALDCVIGEAEAFPAAHGRCFQLPVKFGD